MIKSEELINILKAMGFEWYDLVDSTYGSGSCFSKVRESDERYYVRFFYFPEAWRVDTDTWRVEVFNSKNNNSGILWFRSNEVSLEDVNSLIRICKINLILE